MLLSIIFATENEIEIRSSHFRQYSQVLQLSRLNVCITCTENSIMIVRGIWDKNSKFTKILIPRRNHAIFCSYYV